MSFSPGKGCLEIDPKPQRLFAIGDVHGCLDELLVLLDHLENKEGITQQDLIVFIGDYIDRGPDSRRVIDKLLEFQKRFPSTIFLRGNHEDMLLSFLNADEGNEGEVYLLNGGKQCISSYGVDLQGPAEKVCQDFAQAFPAEHLNFMRQLNAYVVTPRFVFVHAGLNPLRALKSQVDYEVYWIRDEFIMNMHYFERIVVFGHTPFKEVLFHYPYKIGIDTGLVYGNKLTCIELLGEKIIQVNRGSDRALISSYPA